MSTATSPLPTAAPAFPPSVLAFAWVGLVLGVLACLLGPFPGHALVAAAPVGGFTPADLTAWVDAICGSIGKVSAALGALSTSVSLLIIGWHKLAARVRAWRESRRHRRRRPRKFTPTPPAAD